MARLAQGAHNFLPQSVDQLLVEPSARLVVAANVVPDGRRVAKLSAANVARVAAAIAGPVLPVGRLVILATCFQQKKTKLVISKRCNQNQMKDWAPPTSRSRSKLNIRVSTIFWPATMLLAEQVTLTLCQSSSSSSCRLQSTLTTERT